MDSLKLISYLFCFVEEPVWFRGITCVFIQMAHAYKNVAHNHL